MYTMIHDIRKQRMEFTLKGKRVEYIVRCIWLTLQAHSVMDDFVKRGLKYNSAISAAFIQFFDEADRPERVQWGWEPDQGPLRGTGEVRQNGQRGCGCCQGGYQGLKGGYRPVWLGIYGSRQGFV
jgi:hypothetical protein